MEIEVFHEIVDDTLVCTVLLKGKQVVKSSDIRVRQYIESDRVEEMVLLLMENYGDLDVLENILT